MPSYVWIEELVIESFSALSILTYIHSSFLLLLWFACLTLAQIWHIFSMSLLKYDSNKANSEELLLYNSLGSLALQNIFDLLFLEHRQDYFSCFLNSVRQLNLALPELTRWMEQGPLSSLTKRFVACGTCSRLMKMLHTSFILCLSLLFPETSFDRVCVCVFYCHFVHLEWT